MPKSKSQAPEPEEPQTADAVADLDGNPDAATETESAPELTDETSERLRELETALEQLQEDLKNAQNDYLRAVADFQNYRRRMLQEQDATRQQAVAAAIAEFLPVLDNLERTLDAGENGASLEALLEGVRLVGKQFASALERIGVAPIGQEGERFDPMLHEVIATEESDAPEGSILEIVEKGYRIGDRIIRPAKARVSKGKSE
jgi:molecular chaperone GrpE